MNDLTHKIPIEKTQYASTPLELLSNPYETSNPYENTSPIEIPPAPPRVKPKKQWGRITLVFLLLLLIPGGIGAGYLIGNTEWQSGYQANTNSGYQAGYTKGYNDSVEALYNFLYISNTTTGYPCRLANITDSQGNTDYRYIRMYRDNNGLLQSQCLA
jgi:hypothetical protein